MTWEKTYEEWLVKYGCEDVEEELRRAKRVVEEVEKIMPGLKEVLDMLSRDKMIAVAGFVDVFERWKEER